VEWSGVSPLLARVTASLSPPPLSLILPVAAPVASVALQVQLGSVALGRGSYKWLHDSVRAVLGSIFFRNKRAPIKRIVFLGRQN
jgi:hypothetical protein